MAANRYENAEKVKELLDEKQLGQLQKRIFSTEKSLSEILRKLSALEADRAEKEALAREEAARAEAASAVSQPESPLPEPQKEVSEPAPAPEKEPESPAEAPAKAPVKAEKAEEPAKTAAEKPEKKAEEAAEKAAEKTAERTAARPERLDNSAALPHNETMTLQRLRKPAYPAAADGASTESGRGRRLPPKAAGPRRADRLGAQSTSVRLSPDEERAGGALAQGKNRFFRHSAWRLLPRRSKERLFLYHLPSLPRMDEGRKSSAS